jgi:uncharacterized protein (TIGR03000 family)
VRLADNLLSFRTGELMTLARVLSLAFVIAVTSTTAGLAPQLMAAQSATATGVSSRISIMLPQDDAELVVDGRKVQGAGTQRNVETRPLRKGAQGKTTITVQWKPNGYTEMTRTKQVQFTAGNPVAVDLSVDDPNDRVKVIYVPTPQDVSEEMVRLAAVGPADVVYEPGCGDARITIAAIRRGAQRGICIDIDEERARESRINVKASGLASRIDVRHGDALDLKDLSQVTVVLLYMGDHFNLLIRPVLWRDLKVGSRIVSHRFTMGDDWKPDRTVTFRSAEGGGDYDLHLWTITEEIKKRYTR